MSWTLAGFSIGWRHSVGKDMMPIERVARAFRNAQGHANMIGWRLVLRDRVLRLLNVKEYRIRTPGLPKPVVCRVSSSDVFEYNHLLGRGGEPLCVRGTVRYIVDAGANVGFSVLKFKRAFPDARIIAIEPDSANFTQLGKNCDRYPEISTVKAALWPEATRLRIRSLDVDSNAFQVFEDEGGDIAAISLNDIMVQAAIPRIDILKIDIEGSEKVVFSRNVEWLDRVNAIFVETHDRFEPGCTDMIRTAVDPQFDFLGTVDEYLYFERRPSVPRLD